MGETPPGLAGWQEGSAPRQPPCPGGWQAVLAERSRAEPAPTAADKLMNSSTCVGLDGHGTFPGKFAHATRGCGEAGWAQGSEPG